MKYVPSKATLQKYGLTMQDFKELYNLQGGVCPICKRKMTKRIVIDHFHARGWSRMPPEKRKMYVRGLTDWWCNKTFLGRGITIERAKNVVTYLEEFEKRKPK